MFKKKSDRIKTRRKILINEGYVLLSEAQEMLGYKSRQSMYLLFKRGKLRKRKFLGTVFVKKSQVEDLQLKKG